LLHGVLFLESLGQDPEIISKFRQELRAVLAEEMIGHMQLGLSPHSPYTISAEYLHEVFDKCQRQQLPCSTHLAESEAEVEFLNSGEGPLAEKLYPFIGWEYLLPPARKLRPAEYLSRQGGLFPGNLLVHGVHLSADEIKLLAMQRMSLVLCPRSNARLKVGRAPVADLQAAGVSLCLGTDSMASNDSLSIWDELAFAHSWYQGALDAPTLFRMATQNGAAVLGVEAQLGSLTTGKMSAFQVLQPQTLPAQSDIFDFLTAPGRGAEINQVYLLGSACLSGLQ
jgi:cytosine/adenosine deaminase-related metal-dependent hydrolase